MLFSVHLQCHSERGIRAEKSRTLAEEKQNITIKVSHGILGRSQGQEQRLSEVIQAQGLRVRELLIRAEQEGANGLLTTRSEYFRYLGLILVPILGIP